MLNDREPRYQLYEWGGDWRVRFLRQDESIERLIKSISSVSLECNYHILDTHTVPFTVVYRSEEEKKR